MWYDQIEGVQLDNDNAEKVAEWIKGSAFTTTGGDKVVTVKTERGEILLRKGDWIACDRNGRFRMIRIKETTVEKVMAQTPLYVYKGRPAKKAKQ